MNLFQGLPQVPSIRPNFNVGAGFDILTGTYHIGARGESLLNGGLSIIVSIAGPGNSFKSTIIDYLNLTVAERIAQYQCTVYDTEGSKSYSRLNQLSLRFPKMSNITHGDELLSPEEIKIKITSSADLLGDLYFDEILNIAEIKKTSKIPLLTTPFVTPLGKQITMLPPTGVCIDSLSEFKITAIEENIVDKHNIGDSGNNMMFMKQGIAKKQMITQLPNVCVQSSMFFTMTAHVGDEFNLGGMFAPKQHKLTHAKKGSKVTGTTKAFEFINTALFEIFDVSLLNNKTYNTGVLYPLLESDKDEDCTDLLKIHLVLTRNKNGPSGASLDLIVSQREGVLPHLGQFHYLKENDKFGLSGNDTKYALDLVPDVKLSRTTVRGIIDNNAAVRRALEVTSQMLQMRLLWAELPNNLMCTPLELYNDLKDQGYDWCVLLNTREWWVPLENENDNLPELTTLDLLKMRRRVNPDSGELYPQYKPYWLDHEYIKGTTGLLSSILKPLIK